MVKKETLHLLSWSRRLGSAFISPSRICPRLLFARLRDCSVNTELICRMDSFSDHISFSMFRDSADSTLWTPGCPEFSNSSTIRDARRSLLPTQLIACPWYHLLSSLGPKNAQCPSLNLEAHSLIFFGVVVQESSFSFLVQVNVVAHGHEDDPIIEAFRSDTLSFHVFLICMCCCSWEILHLSSIGSPSNPCNSLKGWYVCNVDICTSHLLTASSGSSVCHKHSTETEYTYLLLSSTLLLDRRAKWIFPMMDSLNLLVQSSCS